MKRSSLSELGTSSRELGRVIWYRPNRGFGFIKSEDRSLFFHNSELQNDPERKIDTDDVVEFERITGPRGSEAAKIVIIKKHNSVHLVN